MNVAKKSITDDVVAPFPVICILFFVTFTLATGYSYGQWTATYGGGNNDVAKAIQQTSDRGYIVAGSTESFGAGGSDFWVLKLDSTGGIQWQNTYGGSSADVASSIQQTSDGGYIVAGSTESFGAGGSDFWVLKLDSTGVAQWQKTYGRSLADVADSIQQTTDGGYIVGGGTGDLHWVLKLDSNGTPEWETHAAWYTGFPSPALSVRQTRDGGYIMAGGTPAAGAIVYKLDSSGNTPGGGTYGRGVGDRVSSIQQTSDGGYVMAGWRPGISGGDLWLLRLDSGLNTHENKLFGNDPAYDIGYSIQQTSDGGYIVAGSTESFGAGGSDFWVLKLANDLNIPDCTFIRDAGHGTSGIVVPAPRTDRDVSGLGVNTNVTPQSTLATVQHTNASQSYPCGRGGRPFYEGHSVITFNQKKPFRDKALVHVCIPELPQEFCRTIFESGPEPGPVEMYLGVGECEWVTIPVNKLKANKGNTIFRARSKPSGRPGYRVTIDCKRRRVTFLLENANLRDCVTNPVRAFIGIKGGPFINAEGNFKEKRDRKGNLIKLSLKADVTSVR
jgi:predicted secreted protein